MAVILYRKGGTQKVRGVSCEIGRFPVSQLQARLSDGWFTDPNNMEPVTAKEEIDLNQSGKLNPTEVRAVAKARGIKNWHNKRISTLLREMGYVDDEG